MGLINTTPFTYSNSTMPWLCGVKEENDINNQIIYIKDKNNESHKCSAEYLWTLNTTEREDALEEVFNHYRNENDGFPYEKHTDIELINSYNKLVNKNPEEIIVDIDKTDKSIILSNSGSLGLDICRNFSWNKFWKASNESKMSIEDIFYDDILFRNVLKNRMGWCLTNEGKDKNNDNPRPYMFSITDTEIRSGIRNSGYGYGVSNFRPIIAKFIYNRYLSYIEKEYNRKPIIFDYSGGWGARCLGAMSLNYNYICVDPLTASNITELYDFFRTRNLTTSHCDIWKNVSEDEEVYNYILNKMKIKVDMCFSSPPYFNLEVYDKTQQEQSYNKYKEYTDWLEYYWKQTCKNCYNILKTNGYFGLVIKDTFNKYNLANDMVSYIEDKKYFNYILVDKYRFKTSQSHLTNKAKTGKKTKTSEIIYIYKKIE